MRQLLLLGCGAASLKGAIRFCTTHTLIFGAELQRRLVSTAQPTCTRLFSMWFPVELVGIKKFPPSARETPWFSRSLTPNYFPFTELAAQLEADTGKCT